MEIPKEKRELLERVLEGDRLEDLESSIEELSKQADGMESKETESEEEIEVAEEETVYVTQEELVEAVGGVVGELQTQITTLTEAVEGMSNVVKALQDAEEERIEQTPAASLTDMIKQRAVGSEETLVDGRTKEGRSGPETPPGFAKDGPTPSTWLNEVMSRSQGGHNG